jgi:hypothetical protein
MPENHGAPIAYTVLAEGTPVFTSDGVQLGLAERVLADEVADVFDGIVVDTPHGDRFVDAPLVDRVYERAVILSITADEARTLPEPEPAPAVIDVDPDVPVEVDPHGVEGASPLDQMRHAAKRLKWRLTGRYGDRR